MGASTGKPCYPAPTPHIVTHHLPPGLYPPLVADGVEVCPDKTCSWLLPGAPDVLCPSGKLMKVLLPDFPLQRARIKLRHRWLPRRFPETSVSHPPSLERERLASVSKRKRICRPASYFPAPAGRRQPSHPLRLPFSLGLQTRERARPHRMPKRIRQHVL